MKTIAKILEELRRERERIEEVIARFERLESARQHKFGDESEDLDL